MDDDEKIVEVRTVKTGPQATVGGITLMTVAMILCLGFIVYAAKYAGGSPTTIPSETSQSK